MIFTELLENYKGYGLKSLVKVISEEATESEFNKEVEEQKKKNDGKIRNKNIAKPSVQAVEVQKEETDLDESDECMTKSMTGKPRKGYLDNVKNDGKKPDYSKTGETYKRLAASAEKIKKGVKEETENTFKNLFGSRSVEEDYSFVEIDIENLSEETLNEWNASGHKLSKAKKWLKTNGFVPDRHGSHPVYRHKDTGGTVTAFNDHGNEVGAQEIRNTRGQVIKHHQDNKLKYSEL